MQVNLNFYRRYLYQPVGLCFAVFIPTSMAFTDAETVVTRHLYCGDPEVMFCLQEQIYI